MDLPDALRAAVEERRHAIVEGVLRWARNNLRDFPWRRDRTPYRVLVAEFLLRRTTATAVARIYDSFITRYPSIHDLAGASEEELAAVLQSIGYHLQRAKMMRASAQYIVDTHGGEIPSTEQALLAIPFVGPYIAGAVLSLGLGKRASMVDSNVERVVTRTFHNTLPTRGTARVIRTIADMLVPERGHAVFNLALVDIGGLLCSYRWRKCDECPISALCDSRDKD